VPEILWLFVNGVLRAYMLLIMVYSFGSFFPQWRYERWYRLVCEIVYPYLNLFRRLPLQVGMMDLTPMAAIMVLWLLQNLFAMGMRQ
jgi:YggT family protein